MDIEEAKKLVLYHANTGTGAEVTKQMPPARMVVNALNDAEAENKRLRDELAACRAELARYQWQPIETAPIGEPIEITAESCLSDRTIYQTTLQDESHKSSVCKRFAYWRTAMPKPQNGGMCDSVEPDFFGDYDYDDDDNEPPYELGEECYMDANGYCSAAGTEHCDWDCPNGGC